MTQVEDSHPSCWEGDEDGSFPSSTPFFLLPFLVFLYPSAPSCLVPRVDGPRDLSPGAAVTGLDGKGLVTGLEDPGGQ